MTISPRPLYNVHRPSDAGSLSGTPPGKLHVNRVLSLNDQELARVIQTCLAAYQDEPLVNKYYFSGDQFDIAEEWWASIIKASLCNGELYEIDDFRGVAIWWPPNQTFTVTPDTRASSGWDDFARKWSRSERGARVLKRLEDYSSKFMRLPSKLHKMGVDKKYSWYCQVLAVDPDWQRRGYGSSLLRYKLQETDRLGQHAIITSHSDYTRNLRLLIIIASSWNVEFWMKMTKMVRLMSKSCVTRRQVIIW